MNDELISSLKNGHKISCYDLIIYVFSINLPKSIDRPLNFPQPDWWILKVIVWLWMQFIKTIGFIFAYNIHVVRRIVVLLVNYVKKLFPFKGVVDASFLENFFGLLFTWFFICFIYIRIILPMQIIILSYLFSQFKPIVANTLEKIFNFNYQELLILIKPIIQ